MDAYKNNLDTEYLLLSLNYNKQGKQKQKPNP